MLVLNGSLFRNVTLVSHWASRSALFADIFSNLVRLLTALSQARRGLTHPVTVMFYTLTTTLVAATDVGSLAIGRFPSFFEVLKQE